MKIGIVGDIHYAQYSSIIRGRGDKYSQRIENCIASLNWAESLFLKENCKVEIYLGDFFDTSELDSETLTSLNDINWNNIYKYLVVGNHEMGKNDLEFSSAHILNVLPNFQVIDKPCIMGINDFCEVAFLPYTLEKNRKSLLDYFGAKYDGRKRIIVSHNDVAGVQMGAFCSTSGFDINEIVQNSDLFLNGHLHNGGMISDNAYNVGILTGQNFSEDAFQYSHCVYIVDTDTLDIQCYENPFAFNFYKIDLTINDCDFEKLKPNSVVSIKVYQKDADEVRKKILNTSNIVENRIIIVPNILDSTSNNVDKLMEDLSVDHLQEFQKFILDKLGNTELVCEEISEICK